MEEKKKIEKKETKEEDMVFPCNCANCPYSCYSEEDNEE